MGYLPERCERESFVRPMVRGIFRKHQFGIDASGEIDNSPASPLEGTVTPRRERPIYPRIYQGVITCLGMNFKSWLTKGAVIPQECNPRSAASGSMYTTI